MKLSLSWIKDFVNIPEDMDLKQLAYDLTMSTVEVEDVEDLARRFDNMVVGVIEKIEAHPNADKLRVCKVDIGDGEIKDIVCGGINLEEGMRVAVSCPGAVVRWHGEGEPVVIKNSKLRGVESYGMICASDEIGLGDLFPAEREAEILDLSAFDVPAGTPLADALDMNDVLLEIDNKSMTNRPDLWGHYGIAREIAALYNLKLKEIEPFETDVQSDFHVEILGSGSLYKIYRRGDVRCGGKAVALQDAEPDLEGRHAPHQRAGGYHELCDAGYGKSHPRFRRGQYYRSYRGTARCGGGEAGALK